MRRILTITAVVGTAAALGLAALAVAPALPTGAGPPARPSAADGQGAGPALAPRFEPNLGQADRQVRFLSRGQGYTMLMTGTGAVLKLRRPADRPAGSPPPRPPRPAAGAVVGLSFEGPTPTRWSPAAAAWPGSATTCGAATPPAGSPACPTTRG